MACLFLCETRNHYFSKSGKFVNRFWFFAGKMQISLIFKTNTYLRTAEQKNKISKNKVNLRGG